MKAIDVKSLIQKKAEKIPSIKDLDFYIEGGGPPVGKPLEVRIVGNHNAKRKKIIDKMIRDLKKYHVIEIHSNAYKGKEEIRLLPNYKAIALSNLNVAAIASTIRTAIDGTIVAYLQTPEEKISFRVIPDEKSKNFKRPTQGLLVRNPFGKLIKVENLVYEKKIKSFQTIYHYNGERSNTIRADIDLKKTTPKEVYEKLKNAYKDFERENPGFRIEFGGEAKESSKTFEHISIAIAVAILAIFFILIIQFNSFTQPFMVILAIPFGLVGITISFGLHGMDLSMLAMIGILGFSGVVVNDSLIFDKFIK